MPIFVAQSRPALYFSQQLSSTRNKYLLRNKLITQGEKRRKSDPNLKHNNVAAQVECIYISFFARALKR